MGAKSSDERSPFPLLREPRQRIQHRHVGFARTEMLEAFAPRDANVGKIRNLLQEYFNEGCLAYACFTSDKHQLPFALLGAFQRVMQLRQVLFAAEHGSRAARPAQRFGGDSWRRCQSRWLG